jgi:hypothetical protein
MEPEVVMNLWVFTQSVGPLSVIYEVGVRPYMMCGSDDEMTRLLKELAVSDFHFARRFPLPADRYYLKLTERNGKIVSASSGDTMEEGPDVRKGLALVRPDISGMHQMEYFREALDVVEKSLPTRRLGIDGVETQLPRVNRKNLLSVITTVNVDSDGNQVARVDDPRRNASPSAIANLWMFRDERAKAIFALSGRGYLVHGSDNDKTRILRALAPYDFQMAKTSAVPQGNGVLPVASDNTYNKDVFNGVFDALDREIPAATGIDGKMRNRVSVATRTSVAIATQITERATKAADAISVQVIDGKRSADPISAPLN